MHFPRRIIFNTVMLGVTLSLASTTYAKSFNFDDTKKALWSFYLANAKDNTELKTEFDNRALKFENKTMRFSLEKRGTAPEGGYPLYIALHGGGATSPQMNDSQWEAMKFYYSGSVDNGIYVATRGITDSWKLHSEDESYPLYDKLIEAAILYENVNPNRVYILGFSAGGDGVYQIAPRMPDRFAAANMSAGHHNWITFDNLYNTPFVLQVGELDGAYKRNRVAAENFITLNTLHDKYSGGFIHDLFIHYNGSHNSWRDNDFSRRNQTVIADPVLWYAKSDRTTKAVNSNAIDWMNQYTRNPTPAKLVWDLSVDAKKRVYQTGGRLMFGLARPHELFYWLSVSVAENYPEKGKLVAEAVKSTNTINISEAENIDKFRVLLNPSLLDLDAPVHVIIKGQDLGSVNVKQDKDIMIRTLHERSDRDEIYDAQITFAYNKESQSWSIVNEA